MDLATIGFTKSSARSFFTRLKEAGLPILADVRLQNTSQLAAFAKRDDLEYFAGELCGMRYVEEPLLAPEPEMLAAYRAGDSPGAPTSRSIGSSSLRGQSRQRVHRAPSSGGAVLLCSEDRPEHGHRRLAAEYLVERWPGVHIRHL